MREQAGKAKRDSALNAPPAPAGEDAGEMPAEIAAFGQKQSAMGHKRTVCRRRAVFAFGAAAVSCLALGLAFIAGFAFFAARSMHIAPPPAAVKTDAIIVLTGGRARIETGLALLEQGRGKRLLISGVSPIIRGRYNFAQILGVNPALLECCVDLGWEALNTSGNALESSDWVARHNFHSVLIVTNRYHMLRSLAELSHKIPQAELIPYPVEQAGGLFQSAENFRLFASEYVKFLVVSLRNIFS